ncbi:MAG: PAS domain S-box protein [Methanotrichaceae archaeon]
MHGVTDLDVTKLKKYTRSEQEFYRDIIQEANFFIICFDPDGRITFFNKNAENLTGYSNKDVLRRNFFSLLIPEKLRATFQDHIAAVIDGNITEQIEGPILTCSGDELMLQWSWSVVRGESGEVKRIIAFGQDTTYDRWLEGQVILFMDAVKSSNDGIAIFDKNNRLLFANPAFLDMYGFVLEEAQGRSYKDFILESEEAAQALTEKNDCRERYTCVRKDGTTFPGSISLARVITGNDGDFTSTIAIVRDISQTIEYEQKLKSLNRELENFAYTTSHDLRAPLRGIQGFAAALQEDYENLLDDTGRRYLERIINISADMNRLVLDLLDYSRIGRLVSPPKEVGFGDLVTEAYEDVMSLASGRQVKFVKTGEFPVICCERSRIKQIFTNLIGNSLKYTKNDPVIEVGCIDRGDDYEFYVRDNGIGFDMDYHDQIFEPFFRLDKNCDGSGIGLATVKKIVETNGGKIWALSKSGEGSTFKFLVPKNKKTD